MTHGEVNKDDESAANKRLSLPRKWGRTIGAGVIGLSVGVIGTLVATKGDSAESKAHVDNIAVAQARFDNNQPAHALVVKGMVFPKGGVNGEDAVYNPLRLKGDDALYYAACRTGGRVVLQELDVDGAKFVGPGGGLFEAFDPNALETDPAQVFPVPGDYCGVKATRTGYADSSNEVAYLGTPKG